MFYEVKKVLIFTAEKIVLQVPGGEIFIMGKRMAISGFTEKTVEVTGNIGEVSMHEKNF